MKRTLLTIIISFIFLVPVLAADDYKCLADLYPEQAEASGTLQLGKQPK